MSPDEAPASVAGASSHVRRAAARVSPAPSAPQQQQGDTVMTVELATPQLPARHVLIGVAGSIASVTVPQSILWLRHELGVDVRVVMTRQAATMVTPRAIAVASGTPVALDDSTDHNDPAVPHM